MQALLSTHIAAPSSTAFISPQSLLLSDVIMMPAESSPAVSSKLIPMSNSSLLTPISMSPIMSSTPAPTPNIILNRNNYNDQNVSSAKAGVNAGPITDSCPSTDCFIHVQCMFSYDHCISHSSSFLIKSKKKKILCTIHVVGFGFPSLSLIGQSLYDTFSPSAVFIVHDHIVQQIFSLLSCLSMLYVLYDISPYMVTL